jgi:hypothetical protein
MHVAPAAPRQRRGGSGTRIAHVDRRQTPVALWGGGVRSMGWLDTRRRPVLAGWRPSGRVMTVAVAVVVSLVAARGAPSELSADIDWKVSHTTTTGITRSMGGSDVTVAYVDHGSVRLVLRNRGRSRLRHWETSSPHSMEASTPEVRAGCWSTAARWGTIADGMAAVVGYVDGGFTSASGDATCHSPAGRCCLRAPTCGCSSTAAHRVRQLGTRPPGVRC